VKPLEHPDRSRRTEQERVDQTHRRVTAREIAAALEPSHAQNFVPVIDLVAVTVGVARQIGEVGHRLEAEY